MNIIIFGPNGSGKGTQAFFLEKQYSLQHLETGAIFRYNIANETELGKQVKSFISQGALVPDSVTNPMMLTSLEQVTSKAGWLLDGYPRNLTQAVFLIESLSQRNIHVDFLIELLLDRSIAKQRLLGRRICSQDASHNNNVSIPALAPHTEGLCRICSSPLTTRNDDIDEDAINTRHDIYYNTESGTLSALAYCKEKLCVEGSTQYITIDATQDIDTIRDTLTKYIQ
ncbi:MAG: nucleoside monophosphate kinase [Desulfovibrionaceae bacterium]|nr:nucleoside monophosphate kinase [Desulfovibrionaceae bacterium]